MSWNKTIKFTLMFIGVLATILSSIFLFYQLNILGLREGAGIGQMCGGFANIECSTGLTCKYPSRQFPDQTGTCQPALLNMF